MKTMIRLIRKSASWYFKQSAKNYNWLTTGTLPMW